MLINDPGLSGSDKAFEVFVKPLQIYFSSVVGGRHGEIHTFFKRHHLVFFCFFFIFTQSRFLREQKIVHKKKYWQRSLEVNLSPQSNVSLSAGIIKVCSPILFIISRMSTVSVSLSQIPLKTAINTAFMKYKSN